MHSRHIQIRTFRSTRVRARCKLDYVHERLLTRTFVYMAHARVHARRRARARTARCAGMWQAQGRVGVGNSDHEGFPSLRTAPEFWHCPSLEGDPTRGEWERRREKGRETKEGGGHVPLVPFRGYPSGISNGWSRVNASNRVRNILEDRKWIPYFFCKKWFFFIWEWMNNNV